MSEQPKKIVCPNCGAKAVKDGTKIVCESCDATFSFKKTGGAKVLEIGRLESVEKRLDRLDALLPGPEPEPEPEPDPSDVPVEPVEDSILG